MLAIILCLTALHLSGTNAVGFCTANSPTFHFEFGKVKATIVYDGPSLFSSNPFTVADSSVNESYTSLFRESFPFEFSLNVAVLDLPEGRVMIDAGAFNAGERVPLTPGANGAGRLVQTLRRSGIYPSSIDYVLLTHGHADHVLGLIDQDGNRAFRKAEVMIAKPEHMFWFADRVRLNNSLVPQVVVDQFAKAYSDSIRPYLEAGKLTLVEENGCPLPSVRFMPTYGHTPFHNAIEVQSDGERLVAAGDAWVSQADQVRNVEWGFVIDDEFERAVNSRKSLLEQVAANRALALSYHEQFPGVGHVTRRVGGGFDWVALRVGNLQSGVTATCKKERWRRLRRAGV